MTATPCFCPPDFLNLTYRADLHVLIGRWQRPVSATEFRTGYHATLALAQATACPYWQVDLRSSNDVGPLTRQWLTEEFLPDAAAQLAVPIHLGCLFTPYLLPEQTASAYDGQTAHVIAPTHRAAFFAEERPLAAWLLHCQIQGREVHRAPQPDTILSSEVAS